MASPSSVIGVDQIAREHGLPTVDFLKVDVDGSDPEVLESARNTLVEQKVLGVGVEVNWFGTANPTEHTFHNTDRFMREHGYSLFGATLRPYSRIDLPAPFEYDVYAQTRFGQPYQGDAVYIRDLAAPYQRELASTYPPEKLLKLACIYELFGLPDCAAEVLNCFRMQLAPLGDVEALLDALTPPLLGAKLSYREYVSKFHTDPQSFLPSAVKPSAEESQAVERGTTGVVRSYVHVLLASGGSLSAGLARRAGALLRSSRVPAAAQRQARFRDNEARVSVERFKSMYRLVDSPPFDLPFESWFDLYELVIAFQPDLVLELGRGWGNSTCVLTEAANLGGFRVVSVSFDSEHAWETRTARRLEQVVERDWFVPLTVLHDDIRTLDFQPLVAGSPRVFVFWDAHGVDVADAVLLHLVPVLPVENRVVVDDIWPTPHLYGLEATHRAGPLWSQFDELLPLWDYLTEHQVDPEIGHRWISFTVGNR
jgi:cephalosporin hydroxylase